MNAMRALGQVEDFARRSLIDSVGVVETRYIASPLMSRWWF
ncbi:hypothetical protein [Chlorogloeopsis fritschii]|nr:hypothetical protein [Chlorogloeopsis fritschii]